MSVIGEDKAAPRPFDARMLDVGDGHWIYVEEVGTRGGRPCIFLHGGPGSGAQHLHRRLFDPARDHAFLIDQRGAGRSHPHLSLRANTTRHLVADIETVREHFRIERWLVTGGSWGSTLALAYAQAHPERVSALVLRAVFLGSRAEVQWAFLDAPRIFRPELFAAFTGWLTPAEQADPLASYVARLTDPDPSVHRPAAYVWNAYERALSELEAPSAIALPPGQPGDTRLPPTPIMEAHYIANGFFLPDGALLDGAAALAGIPGVIIQGRYDLLCPPLSAARLTSLWPGCRLIYVERAGHAITEGKVFELLREAIAYLP